MDHKIEAAFQVQAGKHTEGERQRSVIEEVAAAIKRAAQIPAADEDERLAHKIMLSLEVLARRRPVVQSTNEQIAQLRAKLAEATQAPAVVANLAPAEPSPQGPGVALQSVSHPEEPGKLLEGSAPLPAEPKTIETPEDFKTILNTPAPDNPDGTA